MTLIQNVISQDKVIKGDTASWHNRNKEQSKKLELIDFTTLHTDLAFRFWNYGQVVEIFKDNNKIQGELTNFIYHNIRKHNETLFHKTKLDSVKTLEVYKIIQQSGILSLPSDDKIKGWPQGFDGITYTIEQSDKNEYWYKNYWSPTIRDTIPESLIVLDFVNDLSNALQLPERYKEFKEGLPSRGCYSSGGNVRTCYVSNTFGLGYLGSTKLPLGFNSSIYLTYIGKIRTNIGFVFQYKSNKNSSHDLEFNASKSDLLIKNSKTNDFLLYTYQNRKFDFIDINTIIQNHQFNYGISIKNVLSISAGINHMIDVKDKIGGIFSIYKWFNKPYISTTLSSYIFEDEIDYKIGISKSIYFNNPFIVRYISIGLYFENFKNYNDLNLDLTFWL